MNLLVLVPTYPHAGHPFSGVFNERAVQSLTKLCEGVEVVVPRPYVPPLFSSVLPRWKAYAAAPNYDVRNGVPVHRPSVPVVPRFGGSIWLDQAAFFWSRRTAHKIHQRKKLDAILSFDLLGAGAVAWRLAEELGIPAAGWATGGDVRVPRLSSYGRAVIRSLRNLDVIFYQSHELLEKAAGLLSEVATRLDGRRHMVLSRGIPEPPPLCREEVRRRVRRDLAIAREEILVLSLGRVARDKGVFDLLQAISIAAERQPAIRCVVVGSVPAFDETADVERCLRASPHLTERVRILPTCPPQMVWDYLAAADVFAFTSHHEGMPNSLLEAMAMEVPAVAFAIPPVRELEGGSGGLVMIPPFDPARFADALVRLALDPEQRLQTGRKAKSRVIEAFLIDRNMKIALDRIRCARQHDQSPALVIEPSKSSARV